MSRFFQNPDNDESFRKGIDFDDALKIQGSGSICDVYRTKWQRRDVFVKRLKKEFRSHPFYLDALDKEFEIGVKLKHPSLPDYREFHRDYIIMDYIEGLTLADLIKRHDPWLSKEKNIIRMLKELLGVIEYLHFNHVSHCDIKPDNIIITSRNHNLVLIDFDKSYTDSLNDTSGDPVRYGLTSDDIGKSSLDFHGVAQIVEKLKREFPEFNFRRYNKFLKACYEENADFDKLNGILDNKSSTLRIFQIIIGLLVTGGLITGVCFYFISTGRDNREPLYETQADISSEMPIEKEAELFESTPEQLKKDFYVKDQEIRPQSEIQESARHKAEILDKRIQPYYNKLILGLDRLNAIKKDTTLTGEQLLDSIRNHMDMEDEIKEETFAIVKETFPSVTEREVWRILSYSKPYTEYNRRAMVELREFGKEIERRSP